LTNDKNEESSVARHALTTGAATSEDSLGIHGRTKNIMPDGGTDDNGGDEVRLISARISRANEDRRAGARTLYVMKTSMRKNERKIVTPYSDARITRACMGSVPPALQGCSAPGEGLNTSALTPA
jgi:hypothetical protein